MVGQWLWGRREEGKNSKKKKKMANKAHGVMTLIR